MNKIEARARVRVTVEIEIPGGAWGSDCTIDQVYKQAKETAIGTLRQGLIIDGLRQGNMAEARAMLIGDPYVTAVLADKQ